MEGVLVSVSLAKVVEYRSGSRNIIMLKDKKILSLKAIMLKMFEIVKCGVNVQ